MSDAILSLMVRGNLALAAGVLLVLALRRPVRRTFGPLAAYLLWLAAPLCLVAGVLPAHPLTEAAAPIVSLTAAATRRAGPLIREAWKLSEILVAVWAVGAIGAAALFALCQVRFARALGQLAPSPADPRLLRGQHTGAGPLLLGGVRPRIVVPADFEARFQGAARDLVLTHERVHLARGDAAINTLAVVLRCLAWFNPLVHLAARRLRVDQEIACDAAVVERHPDARRLYAQTLLGTSLTPFSAPFGCHWPAVGVHPLKERLTMLNTASTTPYRKALGAALVGAVGLAAAGAVWAAGPPPKPTVTRPIWVQRPGGDDMARYYPAEATKAGVVTAKVVMDCGVTAGGRLQACVVRQEDPARFGFGGAALKLSRHFQMASEDHDGHPIAGGTVRIPIVFSNATN